MKTKENWEPKLYVLGALIGILLAVLICHAQKAHAQERDFGRECLALVGYSEARSEPYSGVVEAERTVITRLISDNGAWGTDICSVANALNQYHGVRDWPTPRKIRDDAAWQIALAAADDIIEHPVDTSPCAGALYFSQEKPAHPLCKIGKHWFYK